MRSETHLSFVRNTNQLAYLRASRLLVILLLHQKPKQLCSLHWWLLHNVAEYIYNSLYHACRV